VVIYYNIGKNKQRKRKKSLTVQASKTEQLGAKTLLDIVIQWKSLV
jgi:hypothetical protein